MKDKGICKVDGCCSPVRQIGMCGKHASQMQRHGKISLRTIYDPNEIEILEDHALVHLYDKDCNLIAKTKIDFEDVERVSKFKWQLGAKYVHNSKIGYLHRFITNCEKEFDVDHINTDRLDNRKHNLRKCVQIENSRNSNIPKHNTSGAKGVSFKKRENKYEAYLKVRNKFIPLGYFVNLKDAAEAYNKAAIKYFGEFARLNDLSKL